MFARAVAVLSVCIHYHPVEISIVYNEDGSVDSIDWREGILEELDDLEEPEERLETIWEKEWSDEDTDADPDYMPTVDTCGEYSAMIAIIKLWR